MLTITAARELEAAGKKPRIKINQRKAAGQEGGVHQATGVFWGTKGNKILYKPARHGGKIEKCTGKDISLWVSENAEDEEVMDINNRQAERLQEEKRFIIIDTGYGTVYAGPGNQHPFSNLFNDANVYTTKDKGSRSALTNAKAARGHLKNSVERDPDKYRVSSTDNLEVIKYEEAEDRLKEIQEKLAAEVKEEDLIEEDLIAIEEDVIEGEIQAAETSDVQREDNLAWVQKMFHADAVGEAEESATSNGCPEALAALGQAITIYGEAMALALNAREDVETAQQNFAIAMGEMMAKSGKMFTLEKPG